MTTVGPWSLVLLRKSAETVQSRLMPTKGRGSWNIDPASLHPSRGKVCFWDINSAVLPVSPATG